MKHTLRATMSDCLLFIGVVALILAINPAYALAQDTDLDGFPNVNEEVGIYPLMALILSPTR